MGEGTGTASGWLRECPGPGTEGVYIGCGLYICPSCCHVPPVLVLNLCLHMYLCLYLCLYSQAVPVLVLLIIVWGPHAGIVQIHTHMHASVCLPASLSACLSWFCVCVCHRVPVCASVCVCVCRLSVCLGFRVSIDCCNWSLSVF